MCGVGRPSHSARAHFHKHAYRADIGSPSFTCPTASLSLACSGHTLSVPVLAIPAGLADKTLPKTFGFHTRNTGIALPLRRPPGMLTLFAVDGFTRTPNKPRNRPSIPAGGIVSPVDRQGVDFRIRRFVRGITPMARVVFFLIGLLLSVTAILKLWMLFTDPFADIHSGFSLSILWFGLFLEIAVVRLLFSNAGVSIKGAVLITVFVAYLLVSDGLSDTKHVDVQET